MAIPHEDEYIDYVAEDDDPTINLVDSGSQDDLDEVESPELVDDESDAEIDPVASDVVYDDIGEPDSAGTISTDDPEPEAAPNNTPPIIPDPVYQEVTVTHREAVSDFRPSYLEQLANDGVVFYVVYSDDSEDIVTWNEISEPNLTTTTTVVNEAALVANAINQHFWSDSNGAHVTDDEQDDWNTEYAKNNHGTLSSPTDQVPWHNLLMNSLGILLRRGLLNLVSVSKSAISFYDGLGNQDEDITAYFGRTSAQIGRTGSKHITLTAEGITAYNADGTVAPLQAANISAAEADIDQLQADTADIATIRANSAKVASLTADALTAATAYIAALNTLNVTANDISADKATISNLTAGNVSVDTLRAASAYISALTSASVTANDISANKATLNSLIAGNVTADTLRAASAYVAALTSASVTANDISANKATLGALIAGNVTTDTLRAASAYISSLVTSNISASTITADHANVTTIIADYLTSADIQAEQIRVGQLLAGYVETDFSNADVAWIENGTIKDGAITNAMINSVSANKLTAGTIDASNITVTNLNADNITTGTINGQRIGEGSLSLSKLEDDVYTETEVDALLSTMQAEIDGAIETWTGTDVPTLNNTPASGWTTNAIKDTHVGDVYFVVNSQSQQNGYNYRFTKSGSGNSATYSWQLIKDSDVTNALSRISAAEGSITQFSSDISQLQTDTGSLTTRTTTLETRTDGIDSTLLDKVDVTDFNSLEDTVDSHTQTLSQHTTAISNKADSSTVTTVANRVSQNEQDISGITTRVGSLETTVATKADNSTVTTVSNNLSTLSQTVDTFQTTVASMYATKSEVNSIDIGGKNLLRGTEYPAVSSEVVLNNATVNKDGVITCTPTNSSAGISNWDNRYLDYADYGIGEYVLSFDIRLSSVESEYTEQNAACLIGYANDANWNTNNTTNTVNYKYWVINIENVTSEWQRRAFVFDTSQTPSGGSLTLQAGVYLRVGIYARAQSVPIECRRVKLEQGNKATAWSLAPEDYEARPNLLSGTNQDNPVLPYGDTSTGFWSEYGGWKISSGNATNGTAILVDLLDGPKNLRYGWQVNTINSNNKDSVQSIPALKPNMYYAVSCWVRPTPDVAIPDAGVRFQFRVYGYSSATATSMGALKTYTKDLKEYGWQRLAYRFTLTEAQCAHESGRQSMMFGLSGSGHSPASIQIVGAKLEIGDYATVWSPSPFDSVAMSSVNDILSRVSTAESTIEQHSTSIALKANSADVYTKTQSDGLISTEVTNRNAAIQVATEGITSMVSETYTSKEELSNTLDSRVHDNDSWVYRQAPDNIQDGIAKIESISGSTVVWNQYIRGYNTEYWTVTNAATISSDDTTQTLTLTSGSDSSSAKFARDLSTTFPAGHTYLIRANIDATHMTSTRPSLQIIQKSTGGTALLFAPIEAGESGVASVIGAIDQDGYPCVRFATSTPSDEYAVFSNMHIFDLTQMFGVGNEPSTVAEFERMFPEPYYPYDSGSLLSVNLTGIETIGHNLFDTSTETVDRYINVNGISNGTSGWKHSDYIPVIPGQTYTFTPNSTEGSSAKGAWYSDNSESAFISRFNSGPITVTAPLNARYIRVSYRSTSYNVQLELGSISTEYKPYTPPYQRAISAATYFPNGMRSADTYADTLYSDHADINIGAAVLNGTEGINWTVISTSISTLKAFYTSANNWVNKTGAPEPATSPRGAVQCDKIPTSTATYTNWDSPQIMLWPDTNSPILIAPEDGVTTSAEFNTWLQSNPLTIFYLLATPTTTSIDPPLNLTYRVEQGGTERVTHTDSTAAPTIDIHYGISAMDAISDALLRVSSAESTIEQHGASIALKANSADVYTKTQSDGLISTEVTNRNAAISAATQAIELSISETYSTKTEVEEVADRIIGRNLLRGTKDAVEGDWYLYHATVPEAGVVQLTPTSSTTTYACYTVDYLDFAEYNEATYTISFDVRRLEGSYTDKRLRMIFGFNTAARIGQGFSSSKGDASDRFGDIYIPATDITSEWKRLSGTFDVPDDLSKGSVNALVAGSQLTVEPYLEASGNPVEIRNLKLEKGTVATEWSAAPEDYTDEQVTAAKAAIKVTTDGITSEVEKKTDKTSIISTINQSAESVKIQASKVDITGDVVFSAINNDTGTTKISGGKIDATSITIGQSQVTNLTTDLAAKATPSDISTAINAIEVGGRNLLRDSRPTQALGVTLDTGFWTNDGLSASVSNNAFVIDGSVAATGRKRIYQAAEYFSHELNTTYTFSCDIVATEECTISFGRKYATTNDYGVTFNVTTTKQRLSGIYTATNTSAFCIGEVSNTATVTISNLKLEKGNKATDWTPAPEDIDTDISTVQSNLNASRTWYATCPTAAATAAKVATIEPATTDFELIAGVTVAVKFTYANGVGSPTLNVNGTGAKSIKRYGSTAPSTAASSSWNAGSVVTITYDGTDWQLNNWLNNNDNHYDRENYKAALAASEAIAAARIAVMGSDNKLKLVAENSSFDISGPILYVATAYSATDVTKATTRATNYTFWGTAFNLTNTHVIDGAAAGKPVYIVGTLNGNLFTPNSIVLTCTVPSSTDGLVYMRLGIMSTAANAVLESQHPLYMFFNGAFQQCDPATVDASKTATNYISLDSTGIRIANANPATATTYQHQTSTETTWYVSGVKRSEVSANGLKVYVGDTAGSETDVASFGSTSRIGTASGARVVTSSDGVTIYKNANNRASVTDSGLEVYQNSSSVALFGEQARIGKTYGTRVIIEDDAIYLRRGASTASYYESYAKLLNDSIEVLDWQGISTFDIDTYSDDRKTKGRIDYTGSISSRVVSYTYSGATAYPDAGAVRKTETITLGGAYARGRLYVNLTTYHTDNPVSDFDTLANADILATYYMDLSSNTFGMGYDTVNTQYGWAAEFRPNVPNSTITITWSDALGDRLPSSWGYYTTVINYIEWEMDTTSGILSFGRFNDDNDNGGVVLLGTRLSAASPAQTIVGRCNDEDADAAFIIGNGTADNARSNALTVDWSGNVDISGGLDSNGAIISGDTLQAHDGREIFGGTSGSILLQHKDANDAEDFRIQFYIDSNGHPALRSSLDGGTSWEYPYANQYASRTANTVWAAPNGSAGAASFRALVAADIPNLNASKITAGSLDIPGSITSDGSITTSSALYVHDGKQIFGGTDSLIRIYHRDTNNQEDLRFDFYIDSNGNPAIRASLDTGSNWVYPYLNQLSSRTANTVLAGPNGSNGAPSFRSLVAADIPNLNASKITAGTLGTARGGTGVSSRQSSTITVDTSNVTVGDTNHCWHNGIVCSFSYNFKPKASLANNGTLTVGTLPSDYRPPYTFVGSAYTSNASAQVDVSISTGGVITIRNVSGAAIATSITIRVGGTFAL